MGPSLMAEKSGCPPIAPIAGVMTSLTREVDDGAERGADDDGHREIEDVVPHDEILEALQHDCLLPFREDPEAAAYRPARASGKALRVRAPRRLLDCADVRRDRMASRGPGGFLLRFLVAAVLIFATYNPEGFSYFHWVKEGGPITPLKAFAGVVLAIGWVFLLRTTLRSLHPVGILLAAAFFGTLLWLLMDWLHFRASGRTLAYVVLFCVAAVLATGSAWSLFRRRVTGQVDVDEPEGMMSSACLSRPS